MKAPSLDDAGGGFGVDIGLFSKNRLMFITTIHYDRFIGDKSMAIPDIGRVNKAGTVYGLQAGPEYHLTNHVAVSVTYGVFRHSFHTVDFATDDGYAISAVLYPGKRRQFVIKFNRSHIPQPAEPVRYYNLGVGWRFG